MRFLLFMLEGNDIFQVGNRMGYKTLDEAKAEALKRVDDACPRNTIHVFEDHGRAYLAGDGGEEWADSGK